MTGQEPDRWASPVTYASLEILQQAIERVGKIDRAAIIEEIQTGTFDTVAGTDQVRQERQHQCLVGGPVAERRVLRPRADLDGGREEPIAPKPAWKPAQ